MSIWKENEDHEYRSIKKTRFSAGSAGSDINVYGMARSFHEAYGYKSVAVGKGILPACTHSHIVEVKGRTAP